MHDVAAHVTGPSLMRKHQREPLQVHTYHLYLFEPLQVHTCHLYLFEPLQAHTYLKANIAFVYLMTICMKANIALVY